MTGTTIYQVTIVDTVQDRYTINFKRYEYPNLMALIIDNTYDDIGDCKGRGLCKTCWVEPLKYKMDTGVDGIKFRNHPDHTSAVLAC